MNTEEVDAKYAIDRLKERYLLEGITFKGRYYSAEECFTKRFIQLGKHCYKTSVQLLLTGMPLSFIEDLVDCMLLSYAKDHNVDLTGKSLQ